MLKSKSYVCEKMQTSWNVKILYKELTDKLIEQEVWFKFLILTSPFKRKDWLILRQWMKYTPSVKFRHQVGALILTQPMDGCTFMPIIQLI
jgi:hypothetical protein